jgi:hypothetical protein
MGRVWTVDGPGAVPDTARLVIGQDAGEGGAPARDARADGPRWDLEHVGDLVVGERAQVAEHDRRAELGGQFDERGVEVEARGHALVEPGIADRRRRHRQGETGLRPPPPAAQLVERGVGGDPVRPRGERRSLVEPAETAYHRDQGLLCGIERVRVVAGEAAAQRVQAVVVATKERLESLAIAAAGGADQCDVVAVVGNGTSVPTWLT